MDGPRLPLIVSAALVVLLVAALATSLAAGDDPAASAVTATPTTTAMAPEAPRAGATADTPATPDSGVPTLPARIPGYAVAPVPIGTARESLVFRTRNALLNGLRGPASGYALEIAQASRGADIGVLVGVAARPGVATPPIPQDIVRLIGARAESRAVVAGHPVTIHRGGGTWLVVVGAGPRRAVVGIATGAASARALGDAVARGLPAPESG